MDYMNKYYKHFFICIFGYVLIAFSANAQAEYKLGKDFTLIDDPLPVKQDGMVEVTYAFWYGCNHCFAFDSSINNWASDQPNYVKFAKMPITWGPIHQLHAALYYSIEALKLDSGTHTAVFTTIHKENNFLASEGAIVNFLGKVGADKEKSKQYLNSFAIKQKVSRAIQVSRQVKITSTPMLIVDGKYIIQSKPNKQETLKVLDYVVNLQKANS